MAVDYMESEKWEAAIHSCLYHLQSKSRTAQELAAADLATEVKRLASLLSTDFLGKLVHDLNRRLFEMIHSADSHDRLGAVMAIGQLAEQATDETIASLPRYSNYLRTLLPCKDAAVMTAAAAALGRLVSCGSGTMMASEIVEYEFGRCFEWIKEKNEHDMLAAMLLFKEFVQAVPSLVLPFITPLLEASWIPLTSAKSTALRQASADALRELLLCTRMRAEEAFIVDSVHRMAAIGISKLSFSPNSPHFPGAIVGIHLLVQIFPQIMQSHYYDQICEIGLRLAAAKDGSNRADAFMLVTDCARIDPLAFSAKYLASWTAKLVELLGRREREKSAVINAIKLTVEAIGPEFSPSAETFTSSLKHLLSLRLKHRLLEEAEVMKCIAAMARGLGVRFSAPVRSLLPVLLVGELNLGQRLALQAIVENVPSTMQLIEDYLVRSIVELLAANSVQDEVSILFACESVCRFRFTFPVLESSLGRGLQRLTSVPQFKIREAAAIALAHLAKHPSQGESYESFTSIVQIVTLLMTLASTDPDPGVQANVIDALNHESLDFYLSCPEPFNLLLMVLSSGRLPCRLSAISIIERVSRTNVGLIFSQFRGIMLQLLADLSCTQPKSIAEEAALVLSEATKLPTTLVKPAVEPLLRALSPRLLDPNPNTATAILITLGRLVQIHPGAFSSHALTLVNSVSKLLTDQASSKRRLAALGFLCTLLRNVNRREFPSECLSELLLEAADLLKIELVRPVRNEAIKLIGVIGALDPYKLRTKEMEQQLSIDELPDARHEVSPIESITTFSEDYYPSAVVTSLLKLLKDSSLNKLHLSAIQALLVVFQSLGAKSSAHLADAIPVMFSILRKGDVEKTSYLLQALSTLITTVGLHIRPFSSDTISLVKELWGIGGNVSLEQASAIRVSLLSVIRSLAEALVGETHKGITPIVPNVLALLSQKKNSENQSVVIAALEALCSLAGYAQDHCHAVILTVQELLSLTTFKGEVPRRALLVIMQLADRNDIRLELPLILSVINRVLEVDVEDVHTLRLADRLALYLAINYSDSRQMLEKCLNYDRIPSLQRIHQAHLPCARGASTISELADDLQNLSTTSIGSQDSNPAAAATTSTKPVGKLMTNEQNLRRAWDTFGCSSKEDWFQWIRRFEAELLKESPAPSLRACFNLASAHYPLARELFNAAFVSCWNELSDELQDDLVGSLESSLASLTIPPEVMQIILNLAEFMQRDDRPLPMDAATLGAYAMKCHAYAKALYYQEVEFQNSPSNSSVEALISINSQIQQPDSAVGILICAQKHHGIVLEESWYEKLQRWDDALSAYQTRWEKDPNSFEALLGIFRCWHALGDWDALNSLAGKVWHDLPSSTQTALAPLATSAAWSVGKWDQMAEYIAHQPVDTLEGSVFPAVISINRREYAEAERHITLTRELLDTELTAMISESYNRAYNTIVRAQMLSELEEVIQFCQASHDTSRRAAIQDCWDRRLDDCQVNVDVWQRILKIRSLVLPPEESLERWVKFASLCRRNDRPIISRKILLTLLHVDERQIDSLDLTLASPKIVYGFLKHNWEMGEREVAVRYMRQYSRYLAQTLDRRLAQAQATEPPPPGEFREALELEGQSRLLARCYFKLGDWQKSLALERGEEVNGSIIENYLAATSYDKGWYKAWHGWALVNFEMAMAFEKQQPPRAIDQKSRLNPFLVPAIQGFFRSISLSNGNSLQDSLRLLTLWFKYGTLAEVNAAVGDGFHSVPVDNWLQVIPQLIARIHVPSQQVRRLIHHLLTDIGKQHPQALIYPLTVASKSQSVSRRTSALAILDKMRSHSARLVEQAIMVSQELIRVAILWEEMWYEGLEEASKLYFGDHNITAMFSILEPLHQMVEKGHGTFRERAFLEAYGHDLKEAREHCLRYKRTGNLNDISAAWDLYYQVFRRIAKKLPQLGSIDLGTMSPKLMAADDLEISVPGKYRSGSPIVRISSFNPIVGVISSKQRPRKLLLLGSDGQRYKFLLKGHEDLRQDERVMQLFGLVNTLLHSDGETRKRHLCIERFSVVPLSQNTGLIGWVPQCDTIHSLIRDYRETRGVLLSIEHRLMLQFAPDYDHLPQLNKIEVFDFAMGNTDGRDLGRIMWHRSLNSEVWLERRLAYTRSLAVMSIVGYILGLGDRHPSNLMIDQITGRVVHIDFGDCFEVAMHREKYPEKVPFRLTRMLVKAMEASGVEGTFRITCEHTMRLLRLNKDSLMAVLEAFVYDPLINWRLLARSDSARSDSARSANFVQGDSGYSDASGEGFFPENFSSSRRVRRDAEISRLEDESINRPEAINAGALNVISRVSNKLTGRDFKTSVSLDVSSQVDRLVVEASNIENLCQAYIGWCAFW